jgi:hypothetical protein
LEFLEGIGSRVAGYAHLNLGDQRIVEARQFGQIALADLTVGTQAGYIMR